MLDGGSGNDVNELGYVIEYLWKEIFVCDNLFMILGCYIYLEVKEDE